MKVALLVLLGATTAYAAIASGFQICTVPQKYAVANNGACSGPATGYIVTGYCQNPFYPNPSDITIAPTVFGQLTTATATAWTVGAALATKGCSVPSTDQAWTAANGFGTDFSLTNQCDAAAATPASTTAGTGPSLTTWKGVRVVCDTANGYYASAGVEGAAMCLGGTGSGGTFQFIKNAANLGVFSPAVGLNYATTQASWTDGTLTCSLGCVLPSTLCGADVANTVLANALIYGTGFVSNTCVLKPAGTATIYCANDPFLAYTVTCTAAATNTANGTLSYSSTTVPNCGPSDGATTGFYIDEQAGGLTTQSGNTISGFSVTSTLAKLRTGTFGQYGGRALVPFQTASTWILVITGCPTTAETRGDCVQQVVNWWRCRGLGIDSATVCVAGGVRIACPTYALGFRCDSSSKKGLLGLLGLLGLIPLLLCLLLVCLLLLCCLRPKKTEGDVHFATFDPHAAPVAGSVAPGTACYAPSVAGPVCF